MVGFSEKWEKAKAEFEELTKKKKPRESKGIWNAFGAHTGLSGPLKKIDAALANAQNAQERKRDNEQALKFVAEGEKEYKSFSSAADSYLKVLWKSVDTEVVKRQKDQADPDLKTTYERALKALRASLESLKAEIPARLDQLRVANEQATKDLGIKQKLLLSLWKNFDAAIYRAAAAAKKVKANPTVEVFNGEFPKAARDLRMQLVAGRDGDIQMNAEPQPYIDELQVYDNLKLPKNADAGTVMKQIKEFENTCKEVWKLKPH
jgi:hypothetical protein